MATTTAARLTGLSSQTMQLLLDRERDPVRFRPADDARIAANLRTLTDAARTADAGLRRQVHVMRGMYGLPPDEPSPPSPSPSPSSPSQDPNSNTNTPYRDAPASASHGTLEPYRDDVDLESGREGMAEGDLYAEQQRMMDAQDTHLDTLAASISRTHALSSQIGGELEEHVGLLQALEEEVDTTAARLGGARRRMERVVSGVRGNVSTVTIGVLIVVLLVLIVVFKT